MIAGAEAAGEGQIVPLLTQNMKEDTAMAEWLDVTREYLANASSTAAA